MWIGIIVTLVFGAGFFYIFANIYNSLYNKKLQNKDHNIHKKTTNDIRKKMKEAVCKNVKNFKSLFTRKSSFSFLKFWNKNKTTNITNSVERYIKPNAYLKNCIIRNVPIFKSEGMFLFETIINSILYTYGMLTLVSLPKFPTGWALRIMTGCWWIYCILIIVSYRASLTAILANPQPR